MAAVARKPRQRSGKPRGGDTRWRLLSVSVIPELVPCPCIARGVDVPGGTLDCNMRGLPTWKPLGLACGTHNVLAVQSLQKTPETHAGHHRGHLWHDRDASARAVVLSGLGRTGYG